MDILDLAAPSVEARAELSALLGPRGYSEDEEAMAPWLTDQRRRYTGRAAALLSPADTGELSQALRIAARHGLSIVPQGGNSGMVAGATPDASGHALLLSLRRMNGLTFEGDDTLVRCGAGVVLANLHDAAHARGRRFPLTLGGKGSATVGGLIATNAGGTQVLRHGSMRALVAGLVAVTVDGAVLDLSSALPKDNRGFDLKQLFIGSEGTLGIVTEAVLRTVPALLDRAVAWVGLDSASDAWRLLQFVQGRAGAALEGFEIIGGEALVSVLAQIPGTRDPLTERHAWNVLIELVRDDATAAEPGGVVESLLGEALERGLCRDGVIAKSETEAEALWKLRETISEAERLTGPAVQHDISVPVADMARFIEAESPRIEAAFPGTHVVAFGHLGDGNIHYHVRAPAGAAADWADHDGERVSQAVYDRVAAYGGSLSAEHGIGLAKREELARLSDPARIATMRAVKAALDPDGRLNPGKLLALASRTIAP